MTTTDAPKHEAPPVGPYARFRAKYATLPPGVQMIGLQLWLPAVFVVAFCLCYIYAFHSPAPKDVPVAIVGDSAQTQQFARQLGSTSAGALDVRLEPSVAAARADVRDGDISAAYVPGATSAQLIVASGAQYQLATVAKTIFAPVAAAQGVTLQTVDLAPLPSRDSYGTSLFYLTLVSIIGGYMVAMFVGMMGGQLRHRVRIGIILGSGAFLSLLSSLLVRFVIGAVDGHFWALWATGFATAISIGLVVNGLAYFFGRFVTGAALILFVFANIPASGGAYPPEFMPEPFRTLHSFVSGTGTIDILRSVIYNVGPGVGAGALVLGGYALAGAVLTVLGKRYFLWRTARRAGRGVPPSMMISAQVAAMSAAAGSAASGGAHEAPEAEDALTVAELQRTRSAHASEEMDGDAVAAVTGAEV